MNEIIKQHEAMKAKHPDAILIFRNGGSYTCIKEDASVCAEITGYPLVPEFAEDGEMIMTCSFIYENLDTYLSMLVRAGNRVAILEPLEKAV